MKWQEIEVVEDDDGMMSTNERCTDVGQTFTTGYVLTVWHRYQRSPHMIEEVLGYI